MRQLVQESFSGASRTGADLEDPQFGTLRESQSGGDGGHPVVDCVGWIAIVEVGAPESDLPHAEERLLAAGLATRNCWIGRPGGVEEIESWCVGGVELESRAANLRQPRGMEGRQQNLAPGR